MRKRQCLILLFFSFAFWGALCQNKSIADSCLVVLKNLNINKDKDGVLQLNLISKIAFNHPITDSVLYYSDVLIEESTKQNNLTFLAKGYYYKGGALKQLTKNQDALKELYKCIEISEKIDNHFFIACAYLEIGNIFSAIKNHQTATSCYFKAIDGLKKLNDKDNALAAAYSNLGGEYISLNKNDSAVIYYNISDSLYTILEDPIGSAYAKGNIGIVYAKQNILEKAKENLTKAYTLLKHESHHQAMISYQLWLSLIEKEQHNYPIALNNIKECLRSAIENNLPEQIRDSYEHLSATYEAMGRYQEANSALKKFYAYRDSIVNTETITQIANLRTEFEVGQKQAELDTLSEKERFKTRLFWGLLVAFSAVATLLVIVYHNYLTNKRMSKQLNLQKQELEIANHTKDRFFSVISHDLRGPIGALGNLAILAHAATEEGREEDLRTFLTMLGQNTKNVESLLDNLLHWSVTQKGAYQTHKEPIDINKLVDSIIDIYKPIASAKEIELNYVKHFPEMVVKIDINSWAVILRNLINNAIKFTYPGGKVKVEAFIQENRIELTVSDTGIGMDSETKQSIFTSVIGQTQWGTQNEKGMGIGLNLVRDFVELNQGFIHVESELGVGTKFKIEIPIEST
ncbi:MAG: ATP-binding protein [Breznakibacter sp.]